MEGTIITNKLLLAGLESVHRIRLDRLRRERDRLRHSNEEMAGELSKLRAELGRIAADTCCDKGHQEAALVAREALGYHIKSDGLADGLARLSHRRRVRRMRWGWG